MSGYLSYFSSGNHSSQHTPQSSTSSTSTWSKALSSRLQTLRKALTTDSEQDDPDNEDCSHVSNVLRAYYTEKGRPFPTWLPPDPKTPSAAPLPPQNQYGQYGNTYSGYGANQYGDAQQPVSRNSSGRGSGLSDLWDTGPSQPAAAPVPQSLRAPRPGRPVPQSLLQSHNSAGSSGSLSPAPSQSSQSTARPLPSQRAGSYQSTQTSLGGGAGAGSRDRLRARLQAGGSGRNSPVGGSSSTQNTHRTEGSYSSQGSGGGGSPYVSASQPWLGADDPYGGYAGGYGDAASNTGSRPNPSGLARGPRGPR